MRTPLPLIGAALLLLTSFTASNATASPFYPSEFCISVDQLVPTKNDGIFATTRQLDNGKTFTVYLKIGIDESWNETVVMLPASFDPRIFMGSPLTDAPLTCYRILYLDPTDTRGGPSGFSSGN